MKRTSLIHGTKLPRELARDLSDLIELTALLPIDGSALPTAAIHFLHLLNNIARYNALSIIPQMARL